MNYGNAVSFLDSLPTPKQWRLARMRNFVKNARIDFKNLRFIHVAGSNGKGSVCTMLYSILRQAGFSVGLYTSPHLVDWRERFLLDGKKISQKEFSRLVVKIKPSALKTRPPPVSE